MRLENLNSVYFIGIGGIGMSALARYFNARGVRVSGYDRVSTPLTRKLETAGISVHYTEQPELLRNQDIVVYTPAIPKKNTELQFAQQHNLALFKRSEVLGELSKLFPTIAIGGTHGKTTLSCMLGHLIYNAGMPVSAFLGGISTNYNSNLILSDRPKWQVMEADEYDRSFLKLKPEYSIITAIEEDHLDIYGTMDEVKDSYNQFASLTADPSHLLIKKEISDLIGVRGYQTYSITDPEADFYGHDITVKNSRYTFSLGHKDQRIKNLALGLPGRHNVENAVAAAAVFLQIGGNREQLQQGLESFKGVKRRFEKHIETGEKVYIDDYAHHPTELEALISSVRELYPNDSVCGIFQPHLFSRTRDFANGFAKELAQLDEVVLMDIYPAREEPIEGITSRWLLDKIEHGNKKLADASIIPQIAKETNCRIVLTIGAGDIDKQVELIKSKLA